MGWEFENTEVWFYGDLIIEKNSQINLEEYS